MTRWFAVAALVFTGCNTSPQQVDTGQVQERSRATATSPDAGAASSAPETPIEPASSKGTPAKRRSLADLVSEAQCSASQPDQPLSLQHVEALGMLDEYISRFDYYTGAPRPNLIEHFYPHEKAIADAFEELLKVSFAKGLAYERRLDNHGHINFGGQEVADAINALYFTIAETKSVTLNPCVVQGWDEAQSKAFLRGMKRRFGGSTNVGAVHLKMANAPGKMAIAEAIATKLNATIVDYYTTPTTPTGYNLIFTGVDLEP